MMFLLFLAFEKGFFRDVFLTIIVVVGSINIVKGKRRKFIRGFKCLQAIVDSELDALQ